MDANTNRHLYPSIKDSHTNLLPISLVLFDDFLNASSWRHDREVKKAGKAGLLGSHQVIVVLRLRLPLL